MRSYSVIVGSGTAALLQESIPPLTRRIAVVSDPAVTVNFDLPIECQLIEQVADERAKTFETVERLARKLAQLGFTRDDLLVAVGGGMLTDTVGLTAALYHRGMRYINVPTTLLGQVDAAIGGKTAVNLGEGKNLLGAIWQPIAVLCDIDLLGTLPEREMRSGLGEVAKYSLLGVDVTAETPLVDMVTSCVEHKAAVVGNDERDHGARALLNYGHTLAHALETSGSYQLRHGEAVAVGLVFAARVAEALNRGKGIVERTVDIVTSFGLEPNIATGLDSGELIEIMHRDKKVSNGLTMVLDGQGGFDVVSGIDDSVLRECLEMS